MKYTLLVGLIFFSLNSMSTNTQQQSEELKSLLLGNDLNFAEYALTSKPNSLCVDNFKVSINQQGHVSANISQPIQLSFKFEDINSQKHVQKEFYYSPEDYVYLDQKTLTIKRRGWKYEIYPTNLPNVPDHRVATSSLREDLQIKRLDEFSLKVSQPKWFFEDPYCIYTRVSGQ